MDSYRPVAVLPALSKVMEAVALAMLNPEEGSTCNKRLEHCSNALPHGTWTKAAVNGENVVVAAFD